MLPSAPPLASWPAGGQGWPPVRRPSPTARTRLPGRVAIACIGSSLLIMIAVPAAGPSRAVVTVPAAGWGPPWWIPLHPPLAVVTVTLWVAVITGMTGVAAGLVAIRRGARPSARLLVAVALAVTAALAVVPPAGSTDALDYAAYGRMVAIGHDPYVMTPLQLRRAGDPVGLDSPQPWQTRHSVYGPLATVEQATAAILGGTSVTRITFWLKLWNALAFAVIVLALDRLVRDDPARRARAHLMWSVNPLLLWVLVAGGHIDALAAGVGFLGLLAVSPVTMGGTGPAQRHRVRPGLAAGVLVGAAADLKITFILFGLGIAWAARKSPRTLLAAAGGAAAVLVPSYLWFGPPAVAVLVYRDASATGDNLYQLFSRPFGVSTLPGLTLIAAPVLVAVTWLLLRRLPEGFAARPAVRPAFALSLAWLLVWPYQRPWYDAMVFCLLALYPASPLDWPLLARLAGVTIYSVPGMPGRPHLAWLAAVTRADQTLMVPLVRFAALAAVVVLCLGGPPRCGRRGPVSERIPGAVPRVHCRRPRQAGWGDAPSGQPTGRADAGQAGQDDSRWLLQLRAEVGRVPLHHLRRRRGSGDRQPQ